MIIIDENGDFVYTIADEQIEQEATKREIEEDELKSIRDCEDQYGK
jgi:hypothetical protein